MAKKSSSERFGKVRKAKSMSSERFGTIPYVSERTAEHVLTVREVAKMFENAGVLRTERSIINWCQPNRQGIPRLENFFDTNERKYYITPNSVDRVIAEEKNKLKIQGQNPYSGTFRNLSENPGNNSEPFGSQTNDFGKVPNATETPSQPQTDGSRQKLEEKILDLQIMNAGKDMLIKNLKEYNLQLIGEIKETSSLLGKMEEKVRQLEGPKSGRVYETYKMNRPSSAVPKQKEGEIISRNESDASERPETQTTERHQEKEPVAVETENNSHDNNNDPVKSDEPFVNDVQG